MIKDSRQITEKPKQFKLGHLGTLNKSGDRGAGEDPSSNG